MRPARTLPLDEGLSPAPVQVSSPPSPSRRRATVAAAAITLMALVVFLLPGSPLSVNRVGISATPTATTAIASSDDTFYTVHAVPWGVLTVDGKETEAVQNGSDYANITLPAGTHAIVYTAPPFPVVRCQVRVPERDKDTCPAARDTTSMPNLPDPNARVLDLRATVANLPIGALSALTAHVNAALKADGGRAQIQVGDHYLDTSGNTQVAATDMLAVDSFELAANNTLGQPGCAALCDQYGMGSGPNGPAWVLLASFVENWRYIQANGPAISGPQIGQNGQPLERAFAVTWNGSWQVTSMDTYANLDCMSGQNILGQDISSANPNYFQGMTNQQTSAASNSGNADGCVIAMTEMNNSGTPTVASAYFLYRCGALIAVNGPAQALLPGSPSPSAHEQQIAAQLIATIPS